ncbi:phage tail sheath C-terminal domain-containing protein [Sphingomonas sp. 7/4-4]|uniref:phage tail sheath family protein n=1 Tax=Sphingomonas sp. 7/4-4 TaxID=3018446 RepID=UPI0022F3E0FE|nr:phage tail sheath C-terminal domain-containing protein [Sphingomonas sp. 7/4-4]WBY09524.1 phage tail sheath C-terminal domain-containing protein [Sphingomonas sp. 7/4-4]
MATQYKTPGVYIQEPDSFPPSIVGVDTAVPCFIGYTQQATDTDKRALTLIPKRIESMAEFVQFYGRGYSQKYYLAAADAEAAADDDAATTSPDMNWGNVSLDGNTSFALMQVGKTVFNLYNSMRLFYANGGGPCYVISCGAFETGGNPTPISADDFEDALGVCESFVGPTMVAIPDAIQLADKNQFANVTARMLRSCAKTGDRIALLDIWGANTLQPRDDWKPAIADFRSGVASQVPPEMWRFGVAYFPPLVTSVVSPSEIDISNFDTDGTNKTTLQAALLGVLSAAYPAPPPAPAPSPAPTPTPTPRPTPGPTPTPTPTALTALNAKGQTIYASYVQKIGTSLAVLPKPADANSVATGITHKQLTSALTATVPGFQNLLAAVAATQGVLPTSGAIAGVWATNDASRGVWNAPANVGIATMVMPKLPIAGDDQDDLNVPVQGLAVNAIRTFQGRGSLIWGARTLDSLSNDWRYIQVRRTMIYVEQSVKQALDAMVFRPNTAQTWVTVVSMIESFLHGLWASGGLMGNSPGQAYNVVAGLGSTMTPDDVLNGVMRVQVTLQMVHPAEFIELTFKQQMLGGA